MLNQRCDDKDQLSVLVCPGFHDKSLTEAFVRSLPPFVTPHIVETFPADPLATVESVKHISKQASSEHQPIIAIGFSAGVVGLAGALQLWQQQGGQVGRLFAIDGWGVPTLGLPVCRISHDAFTHWSSLPLGVGNVNFYADPGVEHLRMWTALEGIAGWQIGPTALSNLFRPNRQATTAKSFLHRQLQWCLSKYVAVS